MSRSISLIDVHLRGHMLYHDDGRLGNGTFVDQCEATVSYLNRLRVGSTWLDRREVLVHRPVLELIAPMVNVQLRGESVVRFLDIEDEELSELHSLEKSVVRVHRKTIGVYTFGPLDQVSVATYVKWWILEGALVSYWNGARWIERM